MSGATTTPVVHFFLNRYGIILFNLLLLTILLSAVMHMVSLLLTPANDFDEMERTMEGIATIFIAYGVVLEERESLLKIFRYYPRFASDWERWVDHVCHNYGILFLVIGLLAEVAMQLVKIPDRILNTAELEKVLFGIGLLLLSAGGYYTAEFCWTLVAGRGKANGGAASPIEATSPSGEDTEKPFRQDH